MDQPQAATRTDLLAVLQHQVLEALSHEPDLARLLSDLRPTYRHLREQLTSGQRPAFDMPRVRLAYALTTHLAETLAYARAYSMAGTAMLGLTGPQARIGIVGATSGAPLMGLVRYLSVAAPEFTVMDVTFADDRISWDATRATTVLRSLPAIWTGTATCTSMVIDPTSTRAEQQLTPMLADADLIVVDARWVRAPVNRGGSMTTILDRLVDRFAGHTRLVVLDATSRSRQRVEPPRRVEGTGREDVFTVLDTEATVPVSDPIDLVAEHLHGNDPSTRSVRTASTTIRVHVRPPAVTSTASPATFEPTDSQRTAMESFGNFLDGDGRLFILRGAAGTGKTSLVTDMLAIAAHYGLQTSLLAPTGRAARRLEQLVGRAASTIHAAIYTFGVYESHPEDPERPPTARFGRAPPNLTPELYLVDEASMIGDERDLDDTTAEVRFAEGKVLTDLLAHAMHHPASKLAFIGDPWQLPPVGENHSPALDPELLADYGYGDVVVADLEEVVRQKRGSAVLGFATEIRKAAQRAGEPLPLYRPDPSAGLGTISRSELPDWIIDALARGDAAVVATRNRDVGAWNTIVRARLGHTQVPPSIGERLLLIRGSGALLNGDEVTVVAVDADPEQVRLREDTITLRRVTVGQHDPVLGEVVTTLLLIEDLLTTAPSGTQQRINQILYVDLLLRTGLSGTDPLLSFYLESDERFNALRATYAYARTCHRSQGSEWRDVVLDASGAAAFTSSQHRLLYTAVTRASTALWATGLRHARSRYDDARLLDDLRDQLTPIGIAVTSTAAVQHGLRLHLSDGQHPAQIVVYRRDGRPSNVQPEGPHRPDYLDETIRALHRWIHDLQFEEQPVNAEVAVTVALLAEHLSADGYDLRATSPAAYQVTLDISDDHRNLTVTRHHSADGRITTPVGRQPREHPDLLAQLEAAIAAAQP